MINALIRSRDYIEINSNKIIFKFLFYIISDKLLLSRYRIKHFFFSRELISTRQGNIFFYNRSIIWCRYNL